MFVAVFHIFIVKSAIKVFVQNITTYFITNLDNSDLLVQAVSVTLVKKEQLKDFFLISCLQYSAHHTLDVFDLSAKHTS